MKNEWSIMQWNRTATYWICYDVERLHKVQCISENNKNGVLCHWNAWHTVRV